MCIDHVDRFPSSCHARHAPSALAGVSGYVSYQSREDEGTQSPIQTLDRGWGSCRDFAVLFVEAARSLGFGARIVSGYLYQPDQNIVGSAGAGSTHAWAEVFVPGAGWITFDPTNRSVGGFNLIPVAVARDIRQAMPVAGSFVWNDRRLSGHVGRGPSSPRRRANKRQPSDHRTDKLADTGRQSHGQCAPERHSGGGAHNVCTSCACPDRTQKSEKEQRCA